MNILMIIHSFPSESMTGSEVYAYNLSKELAKTHKVSIFYRVKDPNKAEYEVSESRYEGLDVYKINNTLEGYRSIERIYRNPRIEEQFVKVLDEVRPDIVHIQHLLFLSTGLVAEIKKRGIPIVFTLHDYWLICPRGQLLKYDTKPCRDPLSANCLYCLGRALSFRNLIKRVFGFKIGKRIFKARYDALKDMIGHVGLFIAPSEFLRKRFIEFGLPAEKIVYVENGMDLSLFEDIEKIKSEKVRFGFIGTLIPSKGAHVLLEAFKKMDKRRAELKIYGHAPVNNGIFNYYRRIKGMGGDNKNIHFMGTFNNKDAARVFNEIDVLVFPSLWEENAPLILREAVLTKTPVVASRIGGVDEFVKEGQNGVLFEAGNKGDLYNKMKWIMEHSGMKQVMDRIGSVYVKSISENSAEIEKMYESLCYARNQ